MTPERPAHLSVSVCRQKIALLAIFGIVHAASWLVVLVVVRPEPAEAAAQAVDVRPADLDRVEQRAAANATDIVLNRVAIAQMNERLLSIDASVKDLSHKFNWVMAGLVSVLLTVVGALTGLVLSIWKGWLAVKPDPWG